jgi:hypothetical protein
LTPPHRIVFLTGPEGGQGERMGRSFSQRIAQPSFWNFWEPRFQLVPEMSDGFEDNRRRVDSDVRGEMIGFAHDGFSPTANVQILLPLEESYVHVVVSRSLYKAAASPKEADVTGGPRLLQSIAAFLRNPTEGTAEDYRKYAHHRVFLGPRLSGTRQTAELVLNWLDLPISHLDSGLELDWEQMFGAMTRQEIHLAFFTAEPGSKIMKKLAQRGDFLLLGIAEADDLKGLMTFNQHLRMRHLPRYSYGASGAAAEFCCKDLPTIATRRVIVCSRHIPSEIAFWLATQLQTAIREEVPEIHWKSIEDKPQETPSLIYPIHQGVLRLKDTTRLPWYSYVPTPLWPIVLPLALALLATTFHTAASFIGGTTTTQTTGNLTPTAERRSERSGHHFDSNLQETLQTHRQLVSRTHMKESEVLLWSERIENMRNRFDHECRTRRISKAQRQSLEICLTLLSIELSHAGASMPVNGQAKARIEGSAE